MILIDKAGDELFCDECGSFEPPLVVAILDRAGGGSVWVCYACLSAACGLLGGALLEAEEKAAEREVLDAPIGEYP